MAAFIFSLSALDPRPLALNLWAMSLILKLPFVSESPRELEKAQTS